MLPESVTRSLYEFLVVYIHAVAYVSNVYPSDSFSLKSQYETATYECNHPGVRTWAENAAKAVMQLIYSSLNTHTKSTVSIVVLEEGDPIARFAMAISDFEIQPSSSQQPMPAQHVSDKFRGCFSRLYATHSPAETTKGNRSMTLLFEGDIDTSETKAWLPAERSTSQPLKEQRIEPIRSIEIGDDQQQSQILVLNMFKQSVN